MGPKNSFLQCRQPATFLREKVSLLTKKNEIIFKSVFCKAFLLFVIFGLERGSGSKRVPTFPAVARHITNLQAVFAEIDFNICAVNAFPLRTYQSGQPNLGSRYDLSFK